MLRTAIAIWVNAQSKSREMRLTPRGVIGGSGDSLWNVATCDQPSMGRPARFGIGDTPRHCVFQPRDASRSGRAAGHHFRREIKKRAEHFCSAL